MVAEEVAAVAAGRDVPGVVVEKSVAVNSNFKIFASKTIIYMNYSSANYCAILLKTADRL